MYYLHSKAMYRRQRHGYRTLEKGAGDALLKELRERGIRAPFIIYAGSDRPEHEALAKSRGAFGSTGNPQKLFQFVIDAIQYCRLPTQT